MKELLSSEVYEFFINYPLLALPFILAFSRKIRMKIGKRDKWTDQETNQRFVDGWMVHASHYNHDKSQPDYNTTQQGRIQSVESHLRYHESYVGRADQIGLTERENDWAIMQLRNTDHRTKKWRKQNGNRKK